MHEREVNSDGGAVMSTFFIRVQVWPNLCATTLIDRDHRADAAAPHRHPRLGQKWLSHGEDVGPQPEHLVT